MMENIYTTGIALNAGQNAQKHLSKFVVLLMLLFLSTFSHSQSGRFYVSTDAAVLDAASRTYQVFKNSTFQVSFIIENMEASQFTPPSFAEFLLVQGPSTSSEISIINGRRTEKRSFTYTLAGKNEGLFTIGSASIQSSGRILTTDPLQIKVDAQAASSDDIVTSELSFLKLEVSDTVAYTGQQILIQVNLYTRENVKSYEAIQPVDFDGFFVRELGRNSRSSRRVILDGAEYMMTTLKSYALFPQRTGVYHIPPLDIRIGIPQEQRTRGFFSFPEYDYKIIGSEGFQIEVKDLPLRSPNSFSGAVGKYTAQFFLNKRSITTDESMVLKMEIRGNGDGKNITPPWLDFGDEFEIYDPSVLRDENFEEAGRVTDVKVFEYMILPEKEGRYELLPEFSYFDTDSLEYITLTPPEPFIIQVARGSNRMMDAYLMGRKNLMPNQPSTFWTTPSYGFMGSGLYVGMCSFLFLSIAGMFSFKTYQEFQDGIDPVVKAQKKANKVAMERLKLARSYIDKKDERAFYDELTKTLYQYIESKLNISTGSLSKNQLAANLLSLGVQEETLDRCVTIINKAEVALFAAKKAGSMEEMYDAGFEVISDIEKTTILPVQMDV